MYLPVDVDAGLSDLLAAATLLGCLNILQVYIELTSLLCKSDFLLFRELNHLHTKGCLEHDLRFSKHLIKLPRTLAQDFLIDVLTIDRPPAKFAAQSISHQLSCQLNVLIPLLVCSIISITISVRFVVIWEWLVFIILGFYVVDRCLSLCEPLVIDEQ
jgi:hypothetical protein